ncbi:MAG: diphthine synthase [Nanoarchaeota archaeon]|jgi:diphthine synthase|nr:diphthine synthase [Nanoarchaeota archaeon]|tara:strand:+ start:381 stop:1115 length:735 start_codon:yes stop_codon:yes gene_type:complete
MTLYIIGLGLSDEKDISLKALETIKKCKEIYLENYTSLLQVPYKKLENLYKKKIILANRKLIENEFTDVIKKAKRINIALLIPGDIFSATTHISIFQEAKKLKIKTEIIHNASILTAVGLTGLELYKFGRVASIPFDNINITTPMEILRSNRENNLHTLFLLDLNNENQDYLNIKKAIEYLIENNLSKTTRAIACARLGSKNQIIKSGSLESLKNKNYGSPPYCLIIPAKNLHFLEEEMFQSWS